MSQTNRYTAAEAEKLYLDLLKRTNPSPAVTAVIKDLEKERQARRPRRVAQRRSKTPQA